MEEVPESEIVKTSSEVYYVPHQCVLKESSTRTFALSSTAQQKQAIDAR